MYFICNSDIREEIGERHHRNEFDEVVSRKHFITRQDCHNACLKVHDFTNHKYSNDAVSVDRINCSGTPVRNPSAAIAYKPQRLLKEECSLLRDSNFLLVLIRVTNVKNRLLRIN